MEQTNTRGYQKHYIEYFLPFLALLAPYQFGLISADTLGLLIIAVLILIRNQGKIAITKELKPFLYFIGYAIIRDIFRMVLGNDPLQTQMNRMIAYSINILLVCVVCSGEFDEKKLYKAWKIAGLIFSLGLLYHMVQINILGQQIAPISLIPGYSIRSADGIASTRPCSFFSESAAFVTAMLPLEFMALRKRDMKVAVLTTIIILASTSTVGVILSVVLWGTTFLKRGLKRRTKIIMVLAAIGIIYLFVNLDVFRDAFNKLLLVAEGGSTFGSRVTGGFEVVGAESFFEKILGTNYNEIGKFISENSHKFPWGSTVLLYWTHGTGDVFLNTFGQLFFRYGFVGFLLYVAPCIGLLRDKYYPAKQYVVIFLVSIFGQSIVLNSYYFMTIILFVLFAKNRMNQNNKSNTGDTMLPK